MYRIQMFPHQDSSAVVSNTPGFVFTPVERDIASGIIIKVGRKIDKPSSPKADTRSGERGNGTHLHPSMASSASTVQSSSLDRDLDDARNPQDGESVDTRSALMTASTTSTSTAVSSSLSIIPGVQSQTKFGASTSSTASDEGPEALDVSPYAAAMQTVKAVSLPSPKSRLPAAETTTDVEPDDVIAFRSKVVSRAHAEVWISNDGQAMIRDVGSSSGTFLNRLRLSPSGRESRPYPLKSGDVIQLGIDYQGRQEVQEKILLTKTDIDIYKSVQIKIFITPLQNVKPPNSAALKVALRSLLSAMNPSSGSTDGTDCCICLSQLSPSQSLFLAPCSHCFHYKCVNPLLGPMMFQCPLCRQVANLEKNVAEDEELSTSSAASLPPPPEMTRNFTVVGGETSPAIAGMATSTSAMTISGASPSLPGPNALSPASTFLPSPVSPTGGSGDLARGYAAMLDSIFSENPALLTGERREALAALMRMGKDSGSVS
ncbi:hypothetical protein HDU97_008783, partial [Phlyctochytrium planicorne]